MQLTPEDISKLRTKEIANAIRKLHAGKTLTAAERALLAGAADVQTPGTIAPAPPAVGYVGTWDELARALGVTRRAIQEWRNDPRHRPEIEKRRSLLERADGRHQVAAWRQLMIDLQLKRGAAAADVEIDPENAGDDEGEGIIRPPPVGGSQAQWNVAIAALDHRKKENLIGIQEGTLLVAADLEVPLGATFAAFQNKSAQFAARVARYVVGLRDVGEVEERLRDEMDADLSELHSARYAIDGAVAEAVAALPFDAESERLLGVVSFDGQDRAALLELITAVATQALRQIGRRAIAHAQRVDRDVISLDEARGAAEVAASCPANTASAPPSAACPAAPASRNSPPSPESPRRPPRRNKAKSDDRPPEARSSKGSTGVARKKRARPKTVSGPAESEAAICAAPRPKKKRRR